MRQDGADTSPTMAIYAEIRAEILSRAPGSPFSPRDLLSFGRRGAVDQTLSRLMKERVVRRIGRGLYVRSQPDQGKAGISSAAIAAALARSEGVKVQVSGAEAAYRLGLSEERPKECIYLTTGPSKRVKVGNQVVEFQHDVSPAMLGAGTQAGMVISALRHLGADSVTAHVLVSIHKQLSQRTARQLRQYRALVPGWMRECIDALTISVD